MASEEHQQTARQVAEEKERKHFDQLNTAQDFALERWREIYGRAPRSVYLLAVIHNDPTESAATFLFEVNDLGGTDTHNAIVTLGGRLGKPTLFLQK